MCFVVIFSVIWRIYICMIWFFSDISGIILILVLVIICVFIIVFGVIIIIIVNMIINFIYIDIIGRIIFFEIMINCCVSSFGIFGIIVINCFFSLIVICFMMMVCFVGIVWGY